MIPGSGVDGDVDGDASDGHRVYVLRVRLDRLIWVNTPYTIGGCWFDLTVNDDGSFTFAPVADYTTVLCPLSVTYTL